MDYIIEGRPSFSPWTCELCLQEINALTGNITKYLKIINKFDLFCSFSIIKVLFEFHKLVLIYFQLSKGQSFYRIPQEIWLTLSRFTGRQEKKDALIEGILKITLWARLSTKSYKIQCFYFWQCVMWPPPSLTYVKKLSHLNFLTWGWPPPSILFGKCPQISCFFFEGTSKKNLYSNWTQTSPFKFQTSS